MSPLPDDVPPSAQFLTHKHPAYNGCTFGENVLIGTILALVDLALSGLLIALVVSLWSIGVYLIFPIFLAVTLLCIAVFKKVTRRIGKFKDDKPQGYVMKRFLQRVHQTVGFKIDYITYRGRWTTGRKVK